MILGETIQNCANSKYLFNPSQIFEEGGTPQTVFGPAHVRVSGSLQNVITKVYLKVHKFGRTISRVKFETQTLSDFVTMESFFFDDYLEIAKKKPRPIYPIQ